MTKKTKLTAAVAFTVISVSMESSAGAVNIKNFRDCKNITDALRMTQLKTKGMLTKSFRTKVGPLANKMMELCADGKYTEANMARKELEIITGPIEIT